MTGRLLEWRHRAYRAKVRYLLETRPYRSLQHWLWPKAGPVQGLREIHRQSHDLTAAVSYASIFDPEVRSLAQSQAQKWLRLPDLILEARGSVFLEGTHSLATIDRRHFIDQSRGLAHGILTPPLRHKLPIGRSVVEIPELIHFDGFLGRNLFHFTFDALNPLLLLREAGLLDRKIPLLINRKVYEQPFVKALLGLPIFADLPIRIQEPHETIRASRLIKAMPSYRQYPALADQLASMVTKRGQRRIFLDRRPRYQRRLVNDAQLEGLFTSFGFERVYAEDLTYPEQAQLFAETRYLVALHGAGMTNLLFANFPQLKILEINSRDLPNPCFCWLAKLLGVDYYDIILGSAFDADWNYSVQREQLEAALLRLLDQQI